MKSYYRIVRRRFWLRQIAECWAERNIVWLAGVRRSGKTCLCQSLPQIEYFDCELPRVRRLMEDPEGFLEGLRGQRIVLDEIHRLRNPSQLLKIAADHYPDVRIVATGSSSLGASSKFKDTLTGRKRDIWLTPICRQDLSDFRQPDLQRRFQRGGLPPFFLAEDFPERDIQEWMDAYWAKDIQELFRLERRDSFQKFAELLTAQSGGIFEATRFAGPCEVSRVTIVNYLKVLEATYVAHVIRPFTARRSTEIVKAPKVYAFDTGFVCYYSGWHDLRPQDMGILWEHFVLNEIHARLQTRRISYWRDKAGHELDFVLALRGGAPLALECKWSADDVEPDNFLAFRKLYPEGENVVVAQDVARSFTRVINGVKLRFESVTSLIARIAPARNDAEERDGRR